MFDDYVLVISNRLLKIGCWQLVIECVLCYACFGILTMADRLHCGLAIVIIDDWLLPVGYCLWVVDDQVSSLERVWWKVESRAGFRSRATACRYTVSNMVDDCLLLLEC